MCIHDSALDRIRARVRLIVAVAHGRQSFCGHMTITAPVPAFKGLLAPSSLGVAPIRVTYPPFRNVIIAAVTITAAASAQERDAQLLAVFRLEVHHRSTTAAQH